MNELGNLGKVLEEKFPFLTIWIFGNILSIRLHDLNQSYANQFHLEISYSIINKKLFWSRKPKELWEKDFVKFIDIYLKLTRV